MTSVRHSRWWLALLLIFFQAEAFCQINTDRVILMGRNALFYEDYVLAIQRFNMVIDAKPWLGEPYFLRGLAKFYLEDYNSAERDVSKALERNPYQVDNYALRALCYINQQKFELASSDYEKAIGLDSINESFWHNLVLCQMELKNYEKADSLLDFMIARWPSESAYYSQKAQISLVKNDSILAENWVDKALEINPHEGNAWSLKAMFQDERNEYKEAEYSIDNAIAQYPQQAGLFVNRALIRYKQDNLRGAMADYNTALELDSTSYIGHYNRGLLRAKVGESNLAIEDFDYVLSLEPDNTIVLYNRALMLTEIGEYKSAIRDISLVINDFPDFWEGYRQRAILYRKTGQKALAEKDEFRLLQAQLAVATGTYKSSQKTRKKQNNNIEEYSKPVEEDQAPDMNYTSEYRGKIQNKKTEIKAEGLYFLTYYPKPEEIFSHTLFSSELDHFNEKKLLQRRLFLSNEERTISSTRINLHLGNIEQLSAQIKADPQNLLLLQNRAFESYHVKDFEQAIADLNTILSSNENDFYSIVMRAQCRYAQLQVNKNSIPPAEEKMILSMVLQDYEKALALSPHMLGLKYNIATLMYETNELESALRLFTEVIKEDPRLPTAYFNRALVYIKQNRMEEAQNDLSKAGELGLYMAYSLKKNLSRQNQTQGK